MDKHWQLFVYSSFLMMLQLFIYAVFIFQLQELVNEKIRTQELSNNLEKLRTDLERIGLDREELLSADPDQGTR